MKVPACRRARASLSALARAWGVVAWLVMPALILGAELRIVDLERFETNAWRLRWNSVSGHTYQVERAQDDLLTSAMSNRWLPLFSLQATTSLSVVTDFVGPTVLQRFYRVVELTDALDLAISPVEVLPNTTNGLPHATLRVTASGRQTVNSVAFFDGGVLLGFARPGLGSEWTFELPGNATAQFRRISARVITEEGTTNDTPETAVVQMDPTKLVPLDTNGAPRFGQFVTVGPADELAPCRFYPEGVGDAATLTGAHFEFPDGAFFRIQSGPGLEFAFARFFRSSGDEAPLPSGVGVRQIAFDAVTPSAVANALGLPAGSEVDLLWNGLPIAWLDGALGENGWEALKVRPPLGEFVLPEFLECTQVSFDPQTGDPTLVVCFHGEWAPFPGGPRFRIPRSEPLKIYLSLSGNIVAHGTVEALFSGDAALRGSVSWRDPNFEVRLQGRNIVIPALASLKRALPASPEAAVPPGNDRPALDAATKTLASFRDTYRALALGGLAESSSEGGTVFAPLGEPVDPSGTALAAWAARLASWTADRAGQTLDDQMIADLRNAVTNAAAMGESAHDLPTVLKLLRDVLVLQQHRDVPLGGGAAAAGLRTQMQESETRLFAAAERVINESPGFESSPQFSEMVRLFQSASTLDGGSPDSRRAKSNSARLQELMNAAKAKLGPRFGGRAILAANNQGLAGLSARELLRFLEELATYRDLILASDNTTPAGAPTLQQVAQAALHVRSHFAARSDADAGAARSSADYFKLRDVARERAQFFALNDRLGLTLSSGDGGFFLLTSGLIDALAEAFEKLPLAAKARACRDLEFASTFIEHTSDHGAGVNIAAAQALVQNCNTLTADAVASSSQSNRCDQLAQALLRAGVTIAPRDPAQEGTSFPDITGLYESAEDGTESYVTLQLNQGGRYLRGGMQRQEQTREGRSARYIMWHAEGMFLRQTAQPGVMEFALRLVNVVDGSERFVLGTSIPDGVGGFFLQTDSHYFERRSPNGRFSDPILGAFDDNQRRSLTASQQTPMHTRLTARTTADASDLKLSLDRYFSDSAGAAAEQAATEEIVSRLERIDRRLAARQRPVAAALLRRVLSTMAPRVVKESKITGDPTDISNRSMLYWDLLLVVSIRQNLNLGEQLGMTASQFAELQSALGSDNFRYELTVRQNSVTGGGGPLTFGSGELSVTVQKRNAGGTLLETFGLEGFVGSWSPGVGIPIPVSCAITTNTYTFDSPFNFQASDFGGPVDFAQFGVNAATPGNDVLSLQLSLIKAAAGIDSGINSWQIGYFSVYGSGRFPAMTFKTTPLTGLQVNGCILNVGVGVDIGGGHLFPTAVPDEQSLLFDPGEIVSFNATAGAELNGGVFFEINGSTLTECGWQFLRAFVAEHHELLVGAQSKIRVEGHTDAAGGGAFNQALSEARANSVKNALKGLLGPRLQANVTAVGFGETEHDQVLGIGPDTVPAPNDPLFRRADIIVGGVVKATLGAPATPQP